MSSDIREYRTPCGAAHDKARSLPCSFVRTAGRIRELERRTRKREVQRLESELWIARWTSNCERVSEGTPLDGETTGALEVTHRRGKT